MEEICVNELIFLRELSIDWGASLNSYLHEENFFNVLTTLTGNRWFLASMEQGSFVSETICRTT